MKRDTCDGLAVRLEGVPSRCSWQPTCGILVFAEEGCGGCGVEFILKALIALF